MISVSFERGDHTLYYGTKQLYTWACQFQVHSDGNHPPPDDVQGSGQGDEG